jgi:hypothetical protein
VGADRGMLLFLHYIAGFEGFGGVWVRIEGFSSVGGCYCYKSLINCGFLLDFDMRIINTYLGLECHEQV